MDGSRLTRLRFRIALWCQARSMPLRLTADRPFAWVLSFADRTTGVTYPGLSAEYILKHVAQVTRRPYFMRERRCLRQGLLAFRFMRAAGHDVELHFGIDRTQLQDIRAHCWIVHDGGVVMNPPDADTQPIFVHKGKASVASDAVNLTASAFH